MASATAADSVADDEMEAPETKLRESVETTTLDDPAPAPASTTQSNDDSDSRQGGDSSASRDLELLDVSCFPPETVLLNLYDVSDSDAELLEQPGLAGESPGGVALLSGVAHAGVEVFGIEWCFAGAVDAGAEVFGGGGAVASGCVQNPVGTGVREMRPRRYPGHSYRGSVPKGCTRLDERRVREVLQRVSEAWPASKFDPVSFNSLNFCNAVCEELGVGQIAGWAASDARTQHALGAADGSLPGALLLDGASRTAAEAVELARSVSVEMTETVRDEAAALAADTEEALQAVRQVSLDAVERAKSETARLAELAQAQGSMIAEAAHERAEVARGSLLAAGSVAQEHAQAFGSSLQSLGDRAQELLNEGNLGQRLSTRWADAAHDPHEAAQEQARVLGSNMWSWALGAQKAAARAFGDDPQHRRRRHGNGYGGRGHGQRHDRQKTEGPSIVVDNAPSGPCLESAGKNPSEELPPKDITSSLRVAETHAKLEEETFHSSVVATDDQE